MTYPTAPDTAEALTDWAAASDGRFKYLKRLYDHHAADRSPLSAAGSSIPRILSWLAERACSCAARLLPDRPRRQRDADDPGYYKPYAGATAETIDGHPADLLGSAGVTGVTRIAPGGWKQLIDQDFAGAGAAQSYFDDNIASGLLLLSPGAVATALNIGVAVPTVKAGSGLYGDSILGGVAEAGRQVSPTW